MAVMTDSGAQSALKWENVEGCGCGCSDAFTNTGLTNYSTESSAKLDIYGDYNTAAIVSAFMAAGVTGAATACAAYTPGTHDGEWYLPALGELYYVFFNNITISSVLSNLANLGVVIQNMFDYDHNVWYWSSS